MNKGSTKSINTLCDDANTKDRPESKEKKYSAVKSKVAITVLPGGNQRRVLENQFQTKKKRYITLKRDIEDKHKSWEATYEELFQLRERILAIGGKDPGRIEDLLPLPLWSSRGRTAGEAAEGTDADSEGSGCQIVAQLESTLNDIADVAFNFCQDALDKRSSFLTWLAEIEKASFSDPTSVKYVIFNS